MTAMILGVLVGAVMGLTGAGGGILAVPALVFGLGWTLTQAAPVALLAAAAAGFVGALEGLKRGILRYRAAILMAAVGICVTPFGVRAAQALPQHALLYTFAAVLTWVAAKTFHETRERGPMQRDAAPASVTCRLDPRTGRLKWTFASTAILALIGAASGLLAGLLGVGGGFVIVPAPSPHRSPMARACRRRSRGRSWAPPWRECSPDGSSSMACRPGTCSSFSRS